MSAYAKDLVLRVGAVFVFTFLSTYSFADLSNPRTALVSAGAAAAEVIRGLVGKYIGNPDSAGFHK